jgi:hypothetical protein
MMRHRFRVADPSAGRFLRNDGGVDPPGRSRRSIGVSVMLAGAGSRFFAKAEDAGRNRVPRQTNMPHIAALRLDWLFTPKRRERTERLSAVGEVTTFTQP